MNNVPSIPLFYRAIEGVKYLFLASLTMLFVAELGLSLRWRLETDSAFLHYVAYLITEHNFVPYRDIFEVNMPGTYLFHMAIGKLFGYSDLAFRLVDVAWLTATLTVTWLVMKPFGRIVATASCLLFALIYLGAGPPISLQRDAIVILPFSLAILLATQRKHNSSVHLTHFLHGVLFALAALVKPHLAIGLPVMVVYNCIHDADDLKFIQRRIKLCIVGGIFALVGFLVTLIIPFLWLWRIGAIESFWEIFSSYTPLYAQMSRDLEFRGSLARLLNVVYWYINFGGFGVLLTASLFGGYLVLTQSTSTALKKQALLFLSLSLVYSIYVVLGGKFWPYHWMPYIYFASLGTATLLFSPPSFARSHRLIIIPLFVFIVTTMMMTLLPAYDFAQQLLSGQPPAPPMDGRVDEIARYLDENLSPTDKVQPLDWIEGAVHAMLIAKAVVATPYITDFQFYHHVSTPYIQKLRKHFLTEMEQETPAFLVVDRSTTKQLLGIDTSDRFPELEEFIERYYRKDYTGQGFDIFRRNDE